MEYREIENNDLSAVGDIASWAFDDYSSEDFLKMSKDVNYKFVVASIDGTVAGFVIFLKIDEKLEIVKIATALNMRRIGVASGLIEFTKNYAREGGYAGAVLEVNEKNEPAKNLYTKCGFVEIYKRKKYYHNTDDAIIMEWLV